MRLSHLAVRPARRTAASSLAALALLIPLAACNDEEPTSGAAGSTSPTPASESPLESGSPSTSESTEPEDPSAGSTDEVAAFVDRLRAGLEGEQSAHVTMKMTGPAALTATGDTTSDGEGASSAQLSMKVAALGDQPLRVVLVDGTVYMSIPGATPEGKYFKVPARSQLGNLTQLTQGLSLEDQVDNFENGLDSVEDLGADTIDGEETERYRLKVDLDAITGDLEGLPAGSLQGLPEQLTYSVWLDGEDHFRRMTYKVAGIGVVMDFTRWGEPVTIEAPAGSDLVQPPPGI